MSRTNTEKRQEIERKVVRHLIRTMKSEGWNAIDEHDARLIAAAPDLLAALERLSFAAECRDHTRGDACRRSAVPAELASANPPARAALAKATGA